jgi:hypothetical protein
MMGLMARAAYFAAVFLLAGLCDGVPIVGYPFGGSIRCPSVREMKSPCEVLDAEPPDHFRHYR